MCCVMSWYVCPADRWAVLYISRADANNRPRLSTMSFAVDEDLRDAQSDLSRLAFARSAAVGIGLLIVFHMTGAFTMVKDDTGSGFLR